MHAGKIAVERNEHVEAMNEGVAAVQRLQQPVRGVPVKLSKLVQPVGRLLYEIFNTHNPLVDCCLPMMVKGRDERSPNEQSTSVTPYIGRDIPHLDKTIDLIPQRLATTRAALPGSPLATCRLIYKDACIRATKGLMARAQLVGDAPTVFMPEGETSARRRQLC